MLSLQGAYCGPPPVPDDLIWQWNTDPVLLCVLALFAVVAVRRDARVGGIAAVVLAVVFISPLCALSSALFAGRVVHHVLLVAVAAPLVALVWPGRLRVAPGMAFLLAIGCLWLWHAPTAYDAALAHKGIYWLMQGSLSGSWLLFWRAVFVLRGGAGAVWVLFAFVAMGLLGALLTFAPQGLYAAHAVAPLVWGLTPLADQQLGGLIMWGPAGLPFALWGGMLARRVWSGGREVRHELG